MKKLLHGNEKNRLSGGREPLFSQKELLILAVPLLVEQLLEVTVGMADTMMVSRCGEAAISGVSLVDMINNLIIVLFAALATGGAVVVSQYLGAKDRPDADKSAGQLLLLSGLSGVVIGAVMIALIDNAIPMLGIGNSMITEFIKGILLLLAILLNVILQRIANKQDLARRNI